ncbi:MAG TPA: ATP-binding cassette domain-containing protein [Thermotogota bacterium]|nr:ATP-binding cassette domain-containing protein [Thermotogota bacterium]HPJ87775.1 ATP-binding cassette domain-containing protein [Thermotogota bacterium]HPR95227.1 ATP-binding cassette domain-containing protein [Thermotogota bacterium]
MEKVVEVNGLSKSFKTKVKRSGLKESFKSLMHPVYKEVKAVQDINFSVEKGEVLAFIGPNGAGKSTTIKMMTGILYPSAGEVSVLGMIPWKSRKKLSYKIGSVFGQKSQMWFHLPPEDSFELMADIYELNKNDYKNRLKELVKRFQLEEIMHQPVRKLSLGQRIRCEIAVSLIHDPEILFLDEPTIGLDVVVKNQIRELIKDLNKRKDLTVFLTSHDVGDIEKLCRRVIVIDKGQLILHSTVNELKHDFLKTKILSLKLEDEYTPQLSGVNVLKKKGTGMKIEVDTQICSLQTILNDIIKRTAIVDMTISETPMEEIIETIYTGGA